jgi:asparagine synthase (glutamine-hydrolysing)
MFRAPLAESFFVDPPRYVRQLMSPEALRRTGYFDPQTVLQDSALVAAGQADKLNVFLKMGLSGVLATQLWHHHYLGGGLCELPELSPQPAIQRPWLPPEAA